MYRAEKKLLSDDLINKLVKEIYDNDPTLETAEAITQKIFEYFLNGFIENYAEFTQGDESKHESFIKQITSNLLDFSRAKMKSFQLDLELALFDEPKEDNPNNLKLRTFEEYKEAVRVIDENYNLNWLITEFQYIEQAGIQSRRWNELKFSYIPESVVLKYSTVGDSRVREEHKRLDGITLNINDPFWLKFYPPNGWNCRCKVNRVFGEAREKLTTKEELSERDFKESDMPEIFRNNVGISGLIFPKSHPYFSKS